MGDLNARVGNAPIPNIVRSFGEDTSNENEEMLRYFATFNELKVTNTFFRKKDIHKFTWAGKDYRSLIEYVMENKKLAGNVRDTRVFRGEDIVSD